MIFHGLYKNYLYTMIVCWFQNICWLMGLWSEIIRKYSIFSYCNSFSLILWEWLSFSYIMIVCWFQHHILLRMILICNCEISRLNRDTPIIPLNRYLARTSLNQDLARTNKKIFFKIISKQKKGPLGPIYLWSVNTSRSF